MVRDSAGGGSGECQKMISERSVIATLPSARRIVHPLSSLHVLLSLFPSTSVGRGMVMSTYSSEAHLESVIDCNAAICKPYHEFV